MKYLFSIIAISFCLTGISQNDLILGIYKSSNRYVLNSGQQKSLESKMTSWATKNGYATADNEAPVGIKPEVIIHETKTVPAGMRNLISTSGELTLTAQSKDGKTIFGTFSKTLTGSGKTNTASKSSMIRTISRKDEKALAFFEEMKEKIEKFYSENCQLIIADSDRQSSMDQPEKALKTLLTIPVSSTCASAANSKIKSSYAAYRDNMCSYFLTQAKAASAANDYEKAVIHLGKIDPAATCFSDAENFINEMRTDVDETFAEEMKTLREYFSAQANQENWQILLLRDYLNR